MGPDIWDVNSIRKRVLEFIQKPAKNVKKENIQQLQTYCKNKYNLSQDVVNLFSILQTITLMQDDRKMLNAQVCYYLNGIIFEDLAKRVGVTLEQIQYIDIETLKQFMKTKDTAWIKNELKSREEFLIIIQDGYTNKAFTGEDARNKLIEIGIERQQVTQASECKGIIANKGISLGPVRILKTSSGVNNFKEGAILITGMTTPDFVPLMKKAAAIVTDEGGITSHAALIARELGIPCIVGTKIATKVFKDGDFVEVDADKGIVRKIK